MNIKLIIFSFLFLLLLFSRLSLVSAYHTISVTETSTYNLKGETYNISISKTKAYDATSVWIYGYNLPGMYVNTQEREMRIFNSSCVPGNCNVNDNQVEVSIFSIVQANSTIVENGPVRVMLAFNASNECTTIGPQNVCWNSSAYFFAYPDRYYVFYNISGNFSAVMPGYPNGFTSFYYYAVGSNFKFGAMGNVSGIAGVTQGTIQASGLSHYGMMWNETNEFSWASFQTESNLDGRKIRISPEFSTFRVHDYQTTVTFRKNFTVGWVNWFGKGGGGGEEKNESVNPYFYPLFLDYYFPANITKIIGTYLGRENRTGTYNFTAYFNRVNFNFTLGNYNRSYPVFLIKGLSNVSAVKDHVWWKNYTSSNSWVQLTNHTDFIIQEGNSSYFGYNYILLMLNYTLINTSQTYEIWISNNSDPDEQPPLIELNFPPNNFLTNNSTLTFNFTIYNEINPVDCNVTLNTSVKFPKDGDSWTESTIGWEWTDTLQTSSDAKVGSYSLMFTAPSGGEHKYFDRAIDSSKLLNGSVFYFWHKGNSTTVSLVKSVPGYQIYYHKCVIASIGTGDNQDWTLLSIDLSNLIEYDKSKVYCSGAGNPSYLTGTIKDIDAIIIGGWTSAPKNYSIDGMRFESNYSPVIAFNGTPKTQTMDIQDGSYSWYVKCSDGRNTNTSETRVFTIDTPPSYSLNSTSSTFAGAAITHSLYWQDYFGLSGYIFSFDNCTGNFVNDSWTKFYSINSSIVGVTNVSQKVSLSPQRNTFYANNYHWVFYYNKSGIVYSTSPDGLSWSLPQLARASINVSGAFSVWTNETHVFYVYGNCQGPTSPLYFRRGQINGNVINWEDERVVNDTTNWRWCNPSVAINESNIPFIAVGTAYQSGGSSNYFHAITALNEEGTAWGSLQSIYWGGAHGSMLPQTGLKMSTVFGYNTVMFSQTTNGGSSWSYWESVSENIPAHYTLSSVSDGDILHTAYLNSSYYLKYMRRTSSWEAAQIVETSSSAGGTATSFSTPTITLDSSTGDVYVFWYNNNDNNVYYKIRYNSTGNWGERRTLTKIINMLSDSLNCFFKTSNNIIGCSALNGTQPYYNVTYVFLAPTTKGWSNVTKIVNSTVGCMIRWCVYANDTAGNWNGTSCQNPFSYLTTKPRISIKLNATRVWWNDSVEASGVSDIAGSISIIVGDNVYSCPPTDQYGNWNCVFNAPIRLGVYTVNVTLTNLGTQSQNSTTLTVSPYYGGIPIGTISRVVYEVPILIQDMNGEIKTVWARIVVWKE